MVASQRLVAEALGVSKKTVSRALSGHPYVRAELREKILQKAKELGYVPDPQVRQIMAHLRHRKSARETLAVVYYSAARKETKGNKFTSLYLSGITKGAAAKGFEVAEFWMREPGMTARRLNGILRAQGIRGLILMPVTDRSHGHLMLEWSQFSAVALGTGLWRPALHRVHHNHYLGMYLAMRKIVHLGYRRIAFLGDGVVNIRMHHAYEAAFGVFHPLLKQARELMFLYTDRNLARIPAWLKKVKPEILISSTPARHLPTAFELPCPLVSLDGWEGDGAAAGIVQDYAKIGEIAVALLALQHSHFEWGLPETPLVVSHEGQWKNVSLGRVAASPTA